MLRFPPPALLSAQNCSRLNSQCWEWTSCWALWFAVPGCSTSWHAMMSLDNSNPELSSKNSPPIPSVQKIARKTHKNQEKHDFEGTFAPQQGARCSKRCCSCWNVLVLLFLCHAAKKIRRSRWWVLRREECRSIFRLKEDRQREVLGPRRGAYYYYSVL